MIQKCKTSGGKFWSKQPVQANSVEAVTRVAEVPKVETAKVEKVRYFRASIKRSA